jgi:photosystem II stability/assembly factor-like uncharacterized protein
VRIAVLLLALAAATAVDALPRRRAVRSPQWIVPQCAQVLGFPSVGVSIDGGRTGLPHAETAEMFQVHTFGVAASRQPNRLYAVTGRLLMVSNDAGCSWLPAEFVFPEHLYRLVPSPAGIWGWTHLVPELVLVGEEAIVQRTAPTQLPVSFHADAIDPKLLAISDDTGASWWSDDAGVTWTPKPLAPARPPVTVFEYSPPFRSHVIAAGLADGAHVTFDGGATWAPAAGLQGLHVFNAAISPVDPARVWALATDITADGEGRRAIYTSTDGGRSFTKIAAGSAQLGLTNATSLEPSPHDASLVWFDYPGTLYLMDATGAIRQQAVLPWRDIEAIVFSPIPGVMYFGLHVSDMSAEPAAPREMIPTSVIMRSLP